MFDIIKKHKIRSSCILGLVICIIAILILKFKFGINILEIKCTETPQEILFLKISLSNWCLLVTIFGLIFGGIWGLHQYDSNKKEKQQKKASEIANQFAIEIMEKLSIINSILTENKIFQELLSKIDSTKLRTFSTYEITEITQDKKIISKFIILLLSDEIQNSYKQYLEKNYNEDEKKQFCSNFTDLVENTLNKLEAICINISSQAAGSQYIYQSLHQEFLKSIHILSLLISSNNTNNFDKYYTNVIAVYNLWQKQKQKDKKTFDKTILKIDKLKQKSKNEIKKLEEKSKSEIKKLLTKEPDKI